ncbi:MULTISPECIES: hypothetical protein [Olivibacter]|uniref:Uncharacterized protein n=1 Tax=Olivibacter jilunii TaxID=985016 RepID=A0ABW6B7G7_9SPHI|nr:hypothetical protein [Pseudosphingobacterium sp.]
MANHLAYSGALKMFLKQNFLLGLAIITRSINEPLRYIEPDYSWALSTILQASDGRTERIYDKARDAIAMQK